MKHNIAAKFLVILLAVFALGSAIAGMAGIALLESAGLYVNSLDELQDYEYDSIAQTVAENFANLYTVDTLGDIPYLLRNELYSDPQDRTDAQYWCVELYQGEELLTEEGAENGSKRHCAFSKTYTLTPLYPVYYEEPEEDGSDESVTDNPDKDPEENSGPTGYLYRENKTVWIGTSLESYELYYYEAPEYSVTVYMQEKVLESSRLHLLTSIYPYRYHSIAVVVVGLLLFAAGLVYLLWVSGRTPDGKIRPAGLNLLPLDLYIVLMCVGIWLLLRAFAQVRWWVFDTGPHFGNLSIWFINLLGILLLPVGFLMALSAQIKCKDFYWWKHSVVGFICIWIFRGIRLLWKGLRQSIGMLPVIWQWLLAGFGVLVCFGGAFWAAQYSAMGIILLIVAMLGCVAILLYSGYAFGTLLTGVKKMCEGDLETKIPTKYLAGSFRDCADEVNALSETAAQAVQHQVRSERMKTELITNVSHDIKTPLTSIINYVDIMSQCRNREEAGQYLEVLSRQSQQLKKLIEDLMELSKASSGNMQVNITPLDASESVNQALGEFSDKLEKAQLTPVFTPPEEPMMIAADGRLTWRVLSNLLSNAVKYAAPGTRVHVDLARDADKVLLSVKNVSREDIQYSAEELLERFVRGDASRNREGSGLGLNIAKSLMEVQGGSLQLVLDGDLFKIILTFPAVEE
jgi:signal transduction histidine kinase